ncbi:RidA family protein [Vibrio comitans]
MIKTISPMGRYSKAKIVNGTVYLCGQFSTDLTLDVKGQSDNTFAQVDALLAECGVDKSKILSIIVHLNDIANDYAAFNEAYDAWIAGDEAPVRTCVEAKMFSEQCLVELTIIATQE